MERISSHTEAAMEVKNSISQEEQNLFVQKKLTEMMHTDGVQLNNGQNLTGKELQTLQCLAYGDTHESIGRKLGISEKQ